MPYSDLIRLEKVMKDIDWIQNTLMNADRFKFLLAGGKAWFTEKGKRHIVQEHDYHKTLQALDERGISLFDIEEIVNQKI